MHKKKASEIGTSTNLMSNGFLHLEQRFPETPIGNSDPKLDKTRQKKLSRRFLLHRIAMVVL